MRFAIVNDQRQLPSPGLGGRCPNCGSPMIAKCGRLRAHHWSHWGERECDVWWEPRTQWHYRWQDRFPQTWQEVRRQAPSGEWHIADVHTQHGLTLEFQYSHLNPEERAAREASYRNMAWVVSGTRLVRDLPRFEAGRRLFWPVWQRGVFVTPDPEKAFSPHWLACSAPVFFDFADAPGLSEQTKLLARSLWCLLPGRVFGMAVVLRVSRATLVRWAHERPQLLPMRMIIDGVARALMASLQARQAHAVRAPIPRMIFQRSTKWRKPFRRF